MKTAVIGSRDLWVEDIGKYLPEGTDEIVSGGAAGIDACAAKYARDNGLKLCEFLPEYEKYKHGAPLRRNLQIIDYADEVVAFWNGKSRGTGHVIESCKEGGKKLTVIIIGEEGEQV